MHKCPILHCMFLTCLVYSFIHQCGHLSSFHVSAVVNNAAMSMVCNYVFCNLCLVVGEQVFIPLFKNIWIMAFENWGMIDILYYISFRHTIRCHLNLSFELCISIITFSFIHFYFTHFLKFCIIFIIMPTTISTTNLPCPCCQASLIFLYAY